MSDKKYGWPKIGRFEEGEFGLSCIVIVKVFV